MTRFGKLLTVLGALGMFFPSLASALSISIVDVSGPGASGTIQLGQTVTFDLVLENDSREEVLGIGVYVDGYDTPDIFGIYDGGLAFESGVTSSSVLDTVIPTVGNIVNLASVHETPYETFSVNNLRPNPYTTTVFEAVNLSPTDEDGQFDIGIGGSPVLGGAGDVHFRVTFGTVAGSNFPQSLTLNFGLEAIGIGGVVLPTTGASFDLRVIPEPGTALLLGLGLVGLGARRR